MSCEKSLLIIVIILLSCEAKTYHAQVEIKDSVAIEDTFDGRIVADSTSVPNVNKTVDTGSKSTSTVYGNKRFRDVTVERIGKDKFRIKGKGQIFEAVFSWVIEDGHNELKKGFEMTDAGAPEWGNFNFIVEAKKQRQNSTLHIILFETSAKDGSHLHQLPVKLQ